MEKQEKELFQIGEVTKTLGLTRRILLNYEALGLLQPAYKNPESGFRYYSAENVVHIRLIRVLQGLGLSLPEIHRYFDDAAQLSEQIDRLVLLRDQLDRFIAQLRLRQQAAQPEICRVALPGFTALCRPFCGTDTAAKAAQLRTVYIEAVKHYRLDVENKMCMQIPISTPQEGLCIVPVAPDSRGSEIKSIPPVATAICLYYRGAYENFPLVHEQLLAYAKEHDMTPHGYFRHIYMEGPPTHGENKEAYVTQVALPIKFVELSAGAE